MSKTAYIRGRINPELKCEAERVLSQLGMTPTQAVTILYKYVVREHEWPVPMKIPNAKTLRTFKATDRKSGLVASKNTKEMFDKLKI